MSENKSNYVPELDEKNGETIYLPSQYVHKGYTDTFYEEKEESGVGSFLLGALLGGFVGAATAIFLAPKTGKEMRDEFTSQASQIKEKSIELSTVAKDKATEYGNVAKDKVVEFTEVAKEKTEEITKAVQEQSSQVVDKVKSVSKDGKESFEDGLDFLEDKESEFIDVAQKKLEELEEEASETAEALKEAVEDAVEQRNANH